MGLRGLKITMASCLQTYSDEKSEMSSNKYEVLSKTLRRIKRSQQAAFVREVRRQAQETQKDVSCMVGLSGSEQALKNL
jgi:hypothetical protein